MARDLSVQINTVKIKDGSSGDEHEMYYRRPTVAEKAAYDASMFQRKGKKIINNTFQTRLKFGLMVVTGFKKGTFLIGGEAFSSESGDPDYREDWKTQLEAGAFDVIAAVGGVAFEGTANADAETEFEIAAGE